MSSNEKREMRGVRGLDEEIKTVKGEVVRHRPDAKRLRLCADCRDKINGADGEPMTIRSVAIEALETQVLDGDGRPKKIAARKKVQRRYLSQKLYLAGDEIDLSVDDLKIIKDLVTEAHNYSNSVVDAVWEVLDPVGYAKALKGFEPDEEDAAEEVTE